MINKSLITASLIFFVATAAQSRVNPFMPTGDFVLASKKITQNQNDGNNTVKIVGDDTLNAQEVVPKVEIPKINDVTVTTNDINVAVKQQIVASVDTNKTTKKSVDMNIAVVKTEIIPKPKPIIKPKYKYDFPDLANIYVKNDVLYLDSEYKLDRYIVLEDENKIAFDYRGNVRFYTKRETITNNKYFDKIVIGDHPNKPYFRVVIQTKKSIRNFKVDITENATIKVSRSKSK